jgi:hypothetical protein
MAHDFPGLLGDGVLFAFQGGSVDYWHRLEPLLEITIPAKEADEIENTCHGSGGDHTSTLGLNKIPNPTAKLIFDATDADHLALIAAQTAKTKMVFRIEVPANDTVTYLSWEFDAFVKKATISTPIDGIQTLDLEFLYTGNRVETLTPAPSQILMNPA